MKPLFSRLKSRPIKTGAGLRAGRFFLWSGLWLLPALLACRQPALPPALEKTGTLQSRQLTEVSGLAVSAAQPGILWMINDSDHEPILYAVTPEGKTWGRFQVASARNRDWEDLAAFRRGGQDYLVIADVGDNRGRRALVQLYVIQVPMLDLGQPDHRLRTIPLEGRIRFRYPDGPRDCEAVAVDVRHNRIVLLTKRDQPPRFYALPLAPAGSGENIATAEYLADWSVKPARGSGPKSPDRHPQKQQPTALALDAQGRTLMILTYQDIYCYPCPENPAEWQRLAQSRPRVIKLPAPASIFLKQREAMAFDPWQKALWVTSEGRQAGIYRIVPQNPGRLARNGHQRPASIPAGIKAVPARF